MSEVGANYLCYPSTESRVLQLHFVGRMILFESFIRYFKTCSAEVKNDGLCSRRCYLFQLSKSVVILCLTLTVCQAKEVKDVNNCTVNHMFNRTINRCIGEYKIFT